MKEYFKQLIESLEEIKRNSCNGCACYELADKIIKQYQVCEHLEGLQLGRCPECGKQITNPEPDNG